MTRQKTNNVRTDPGTGTGQRLKIRRDIAVAQTEPGRAPRRRGDGAQGRRQTLYNFQ
jgi:hypothetical protein